MRENLERKMEEIEKMENEREALFENEVENKELIVSSYYEIQLKKYDYLHAKRRQLAYEMEKAESESLKKHLELINRVNENVIFVLSKSLVDNGFEDRIKVEDNV